MSNNITAVTYINNIDLSHTALCQIILLQLPISIIWLIDLSHMVTLCQMSKNITAVTYSQ